MTDAAHPRTAVLQPPIMPGMTAAQRTRLVGVDNIERRARANSAWAIPGICSVPGCDADRYFPKSGLCPIHARNNISQEVVLMDADPE